MNDIEKAIAEIERQYKIGADYSNGKDHTVACLLDEQAELVIAALHEKQEREKGCEYCNTNALISFKYKEASGNTEFYFAKHCPVCGRRLGVGE